MKQHIEKAFKEGFEMGGRPDAWKSAQEAWVNSDAEEYTGQSKSMSLLEAVVNTVIGLVVAMFATAAICKA